MTIEITLNYNILSLCISLKLCMSLDIDTVGTVNYRNKKKTGDIPLLYYYNLLRCKLDDYLLNLIT